jgi:hypothetical protein
MVFSAIMFEVIVLLVILGVSSHKALCHPCWFSWRVLFGLGGWLSSRFRITISSLWLLWGLMVGSACVTVHCSLGHWVVFTTNGRAVGYIVLSRPCLHLSVVVV